MKILNKKGKKEHVSTFFHSKHTEKEFRKYYYLFSVLVGLLFFLTCLIMFTVTNNILVSVILILISGIILYLLKDRYIVSIVESVMQYSKTRHGEKSEKTSTYSKKIGTANKNISYEKSSSNFFKSLLRNISFKKLKRKLFKQDESKDSYIEIK